MADKSIEKTGIKPGEVAVGTGGANKGLKIRVLFDWEKGSGGVIPGPFEVLEGGTGESRTRDGVLHRRGQLFQKYIGMRFDSGKDFLLELQKHDPQVSHPINANTMKIDSSYLPSGEKRLGGQQQHNDDLPSREWIKGLIRRLKEEGSVGDGGGIKVSLLKREIEAGYYAAQGKTPPDEWWEKVETMLRSQDPRG